MNTELNFTDVKDIVIDCLLKVGIIVDSSAEDTNILDYGIDSISYVTFIIELEDSLGIDLPESVFNYEVLRSLNGFSNMLVDIIND